MVCSAGGRFAGCWLGLLLLFPCLIEHAGAGWCRCVGVAGWNACAVGSDGSRRGVVGGFGTLLGPEGTPVVVLFSGPPCSAWWSNGSVVGLVAACGWGCGCVLSVA